MAYGALYIDGEIQEVPEDIERVQLEFDWDGDKLCQQCFEPIEELIDTSEAEPEARWYHNDTDIDSDHTPEPETGPSSWCNSAFFEFDSEEDSVTVGISVGDPRGAFTFTIRRLPAEAEDGGRLVMHLPYPGGSWLHEPLTLLHEGTYLIGRDHEYS